MSGKAYCYRCRGKKYSSLRWSNDWWSTEGKGFDILTTKKLSLHFDAAKIPLRLSVLHYENQASMSRTCNFFFGLTHGHWTGCQNQLAYTVELLITTAQKFEFPDFPEIPTESPRLPAYCMPSGEYIVWCKYCRRWHQHSKIDTGPSVAACYRQTPYNFIGYDLTPAGAASEKMLQDAERRRPLGPDLLGFDEPRSEKILDSV